MLGYSGRLLFDHEIAPQQWMDNTCIFDAGAVPVPGAIVVGAVATSCDAGDAGDADNANCTGGAGATGAIEGAGCVGDAAGCW